MTMPTPATSIAATAAQYLNVWTDHSTRRSGRTTRMLEALVFEVVNNERQVVVVAADCCQQQEFRKLIEILLDRYDCRDDRPSTLIYYTTVTESLRGFGSWPCYSKQLPIFFVDHRAKEILTETWIARQVVGLGRAE